MPNGHTLGVLTRLGERVEILEWANRLEGPHDDPRARLSNLAVEGYLSGHIPRAAFRNVAYRADGLRYETAGEVMAYFAAEVALAPGPASKPGAAWEGLLNEAISKAAEYGIRREDSGWDDCEVWAALIDEPIDPDLPDAHRWSPVEGEAELAEWESLLGTR